MPQCATCSGAGFKVQQLNWKSPLIRIRCKRCRGTGYITRMKTMTPEQCKQAAAIMQKYGEPGWSIEWSHRSSNLYVRDENPPSWSWLHYKYRAVLTEQERTAQKLPLSHYKPGMFVIASLDGCRVTGLVVDVVAIDATKGTVHIFYNPGPLYPNRRVSPEDILSWRWPHEENWTQAFTVVDKPLVVKYLTVEGL